MPLEKPKQSNSLPKALHFSVVPITHKTSVSRLPTKGLDSALCEWGPSSLSTVVEALANLEKQVLELDNADGDISGIVLRYGHFYGPATSTFQAISKGKRGVYTVVDDCPVSAAGWVTKHAMIVVAASAPPEISKDAAEKNLDPFTCYFMTEQKGVGLGS
ncbi:epimerase dehydratase [Seminavis robusta]|uniref:Epimerase dehydratase n=1 Tax=Seminavis robusta TaxID=568900 RepID=A0A9N8H4E0_9STRA|nr:epimerase dehydratase [Seminavis robusta]|eukprot:Sro60_g034600.1 epimerase dehydratase (160) ;mRNA; f:42364-42960